MRAALVIARRELVAQHLTVGGAVIVALFVLFTGAVHFVVGPALVGRGFVQGRPASLALFFETALWVLFLVGPALSMRTLSEEIRLGTLEVLMTAPIRERDIVLGKFLGGLGFLAALLLPTLVFVLAVEWHGRPDYGEIASGYLGLLLVGAAWLATGILASSLTASQVLAYLVTIFTWLLLLVLTVGVPILGGIAEGLAGNPGTSEIGRRALEAVAAVGGFLAEGNPLARARGFVNGLLDSFSVVYFVALAAVFLFAASRCVAARRWA